MDGSSGVDLDEAGEVDLERVLADVRAVRDAVQRGETSFENLEAAMLGAGRRNEGSVINGDLRSTVVG